MITVYGFPNTRSTRITWLLEELGEDYHYHLIDFMQGEHKSAEFLAINPAGKVPAVKINDLLMTESGAIVSYLADSFADRGLIPAVGSQQRAHYEQWSYFVLCELEQGLWTMGKHRFALPAELRVASVIATAEWEFQQALSLLSEGLGEADYLLGNHFSAVDVLAAHTLSWAEAFKQPIEQANLQAYMQRCMLRPALLRAKQKEADAQTTKN